MPELRPCIGYSGNPCPDNEMTLNDPPRCRDCDLDWLTDGRCPHGVDLDDDCYTCGPHDMIGAVRMWRESVGHDPGDEDRHP